MKKFVFDNQKDCFESKDNTETNISNKKYKYNHYHYHVGDFEQLKKEIDKIKEPNQKHKINKKNCFFNEYSNISISNNINSTKKFYKKK